MRPSYAVTLAIAAVAIDALYRPHPLRAGHVLCDLDFDVAQVALSGAAPALLLGRVV